jgi:mannan endo-1,4-beta-mannosidase
VDAYTPYYPGDDVVDVLATDVYRGGFADEDYEQLLALAGERPIALGEVGYLPTPEKLRQQPCWTWFMAWGEPVGEWSDGKSLRENYECDETLTLADLPWTQVRQPKIHHPILK